MNKRITSILLCFVLVLSMMVSAVPTFAYEVKTTSFTVTPGETSANPGDTITFDLEMGAVDGLYGLFLELIIPDGLTYVEGSGKVTEGLLDLMDAADVEFDESVCTFGVGNCDYTSTESTILMTFQCTVDDDVLGSNSEIVKTVEVYAEEGNVFDQDYDDIAFTLNNANVIITAKQVNVPVTGVTVDETMSLEIGEDKPLNVTVSPADATNKDVTFKVTEGEGIVTVDASGNVTGVKKGVAVVTVTTADGNWTDVCTVTVSCPHRNIIPHEEVTANCQHGGNEEYKECGTCGQLFDAFGEVELDAIPVTEKDMSNHAGTAEWTKTAEKHSKTYDCCDKVVVPEEDHEWEDGVCGECGFECEHSGGTATCVAAKTCEYCDESYGEVDKDNHVGGTYLEGAASADHMNGTPGYTGDTKCSSCHKTLEFGLPIEPGDHANNAGSWDSNGTEHWKVCDVVVGCGVVIDGTNAPHTSDIPENQATCQTQAVCDVCEASYGELGECVPGEKWENDEWEHWKVCSVSGCGETISSTVSEHIDLNEDGECDVCEYAIPKYYAVEFNSMGGTSVETQYIKDGQTATEPEEPTKEGFEFVGWTLEDKVYDFSHAVTGDIVLVAVWSEIQAPPAEPETITVTVVKEWDAPEGTVLPEAITVVLMGNGQEVERTVLAERNDWTYTFADMPVNGEDGGAIVYTVDELEVPEGFEKSVSEPIEDETGIELAIINSYVGTEPGPGPEPDPEPETFTVTVVKEWDAPEGTVLPEAITVVLLGNGQEVERTVLAERNDWRYTFADMPVNGEDGGAIVYTVDELEVPEGFEKSVSEPIEDETGIELAIINSYVGNEPGPGPEPPVEPETITVTVVKEWDTPETVERPTSVTVALLANGEIAMEPVELTADMDWTCTWENLPVNGEDSGEIVYTVDELEVPEGFEKSVSDPIEGENGIEFVITNSYVETEPGPGPEPETETVTVAGTKTWVGDKEADRPERIIVNLLANGEVINEAEVTAITQWTFSFNELPKNDEAGAEIEYSVQEEEVEGYTATYDGYNITNTLISEGPGGGDQPGGNQPGGDQPGGNQPGDEPGNNRPGFIPSYGEDDVEEPGEEVKPGEDEEDEPGEAVVPGNDEEPGDDEEEADEEAVVENNPDDTPKTGDNSNIALWAMLLAISGIGTILSKKRSSVK